MAAYNTFAIFIPQVMYSKLNNTRNNIHSFSSSESFLMFHCELKLVFLFVFVVFFCVLCFYFLDLTDHLHNCRLIHTSQIRNSLLCFSLKDGQKKYVVLANSKMYGVYFFELFREQKKTIKKLKNPMTGWSVATLSAPIQFNI